LAGSKDDGVGEVMMAQGQSARKARASALAPSATPLLHASVESAPFVCGGLVEPEFVSVLLESGALSVALASAGAEVASAISVFPGSVPLGR
jgi:hypothetical protein